MTRLILILTPLLLLLLLMIIIIIMTILILLLLLIVIMILLIRIRDPAGVLERDREAVLRVSRLLGLAISDEIGAPDPN